MSFAARARAAADRRRRRFYYEVMRPQQPLAQVFAALAPGLDVDLLAPGGFQRLWAAHLVATPGSLWQVTPPAAQDAIERARRDQFSVLMRTFTITPETDWHADLFHGIPWPNVHVDSCPFSVPGADLVLVWHLNRMSCLVDLVGAYRATGDESMAARAHALMDSWAGANPYLVGANWMSPMETGLRLVAWSVALAGMGAAPLPDAQRCERILRSVLRQAGFLSSHFSRWPIPNNHLIGEAATLTAFATYWPILGQSANWMEQAEATLAEEARRQVLKDGFQFENSVNYHMVTLDYFLVYLHAKLLRGETPQAVVLEQTRVMAEAALALVSPSGRMPMIGDDSMPHFVVLGGAMGSPGPLAESVSFEDFLRVEHARLFSTTAWGRDLLALRKPRSVAHRFHEAGIDVTRDEHSHIVFTHGPQHHHPFSNGHLHADAGGFELELDGAPLIVDSGTYLYGVDAGLRRHMRGARAHNTVIVDGVEPMTPGAAFQWETVSAGVALAFGAVDDVMATGCRRRLPATQARSVDHVRVLVRVGPTIIIADALSPRAQAAGVAHTAALHFHTTVAPGVAVQDGHCVRLTDAARFVRIFEVLDEPRAQVDLIHDRRDWASLYSSAYGEAATGTTIRVGVPVEAPVVLVSVLRSPEVSVTRAQTRPGHIGCAVTEAHTRRIVSVRLDPFAVYVGGRAIVGSAVARPPVHAAHHTPDSLEWLGDLDT